MPTTRVLRSAPPAVARDGALLTAARIGLALTAGAFGARYIAAHALLPGLPPLPSWLPGGALLAILAGLLLLATAALLLLNTLPRTAAVVLGAFLSLSALLYLTHLEDVLHNGSIRTGFLEPLALGAACFLLAGATAPTARDLPRLPAAVPAVARYTLAATLVIFGVQHFEYLPFVAVLIPGWLGAARFWTEFTGVALLLSGLSIGARILDRFAGLGLALMFFLWLLMLHGPRIVAHPENGNEWTSGFVALGFLAIGLLVAAIGRSPHPRAAI